MLVQEGGDTVIKLKDKERVLRHLIELCPSNKGSITALTDELFFSLPNITDTDFVNCIISLREDGYIKTRFFDDKQELHLYVEIVFLPKAYFFHDSQEIERKALRKDTRRYWITTIVAIIGAFTGTVALLWQLWTSLTP